MSSYKYCKFVCGCRKHHYSRMLFVILALVPFFCNAQLSHIPLDDKNKPNEPTVSIHPGSGDIVAASNIDNFYTLKSNAIQKFKATSTLGIYGDPVLHYSDTNLFFAHLSKTPNKNYGDWFDRIVVQKVHSIHPWKETSYSVGYNLDKMQDKPWMSSDNHSPNYNGHVYVTWTEFDKYDSDDPNDFSRIRFSKYVPTSDSFSSAITISDSTGDCRDGDNTLEGVSTAVGPFGQIYAAWSGHNRIWFDKSLDGGHSWGKDQVMGRQLRGWDMEMPNIHRANGMPFIQCDIKRNIIYVCWAEEDDNSANIILKYSRDNGDSWSDPIEMSTEIGHQSHQYFPNMSLHKESGQIFIAYYDQQYSDKHLFYDISLSQINVSESSLPIIHTITKQSIPLPGKDVFYGDYLDIDIVDDQLAVIYSTYYDNRMAIELATSTIPLMDTKSDGTTPYSRALLVGKDSSSVIYINVKSPGKIKGKCKYGKELVKKKIKVKRNWTIEDINTDYLLFSIPKGKPYKLKYKIRDNNTRRKYTYFSKVHI
ncbi:glycoside hydrolase [Bacteroidia bacterium]|nr:glycoside hydrolase [Bacteroidia bacterium]MDC1395734.1 glycoside hydrolase [Bacteroidia bacterium]